MTGETASRTAAGVRKQLVGVVVSDRMTKTVVVRVSRLVRHPMYQRVMRRAKKFKADTSALEVHVGDEVRIEETRPLSKEKRWRVIELLRRGPGVEPELKQVSG